MTTLNTKISRLVVIACASGLVLASAGFGGLYAYRVGVQLSPELAWLSVLMALALEGTKPLAVSAAYQAFKSWEFVQCALLVVLALVAIAYSLTAELSLMATSRGDLVASREQASETAKDTQAGKARITQELASLGFLEPSRALRARLRAKPNSTSLQAALAKAERRETLLAQLDGLQTVTSPSVVKLADPGSTSIVTYLGLLGFTPSVATVSQWLNLVPVIALEIGSALAFLLISSSYVSVSNPLQEPLDTSGASVPSGMVVVAENPSPDSPQTEPTKEALVLATLKEAGGKLEDSERALAKRIGTNRAATRKALNCLVIAGLISVEAIARQGTMIRLIS